MRIALRMLVLATVVSPTLEAVGVMTADLHKALIGQWVVDERARLEASPLWQFSTPEKRKELEKQTLSMPAVSFEFKETTYSLMAGPPIAYKIVKRDANRLMLETSEKVDGNEIKDEMTFEYIDNASWRLTVKSQGFPLIIKRSK